MEEGRSPEWPSKERYDMVKRHLYQDRKFHLAIAGKSGTGKSSLINAFRGIWDGEEGSASTDVVESTTTVTPYPDPNPANPFIWFDIPGSGTVNCPDWTYFNDQGLYIFDAIIVLLGDRFTESDLAILKNCKRYSIPTYIVRSKSDIHIEDLAEKKRRVADPRADLIKIADEARNEYLAKTQETVRRNLMNIDPPPLPQRVYAVSRNTLTLLVREESLDDLDVLDEHELLRDLLQDAYSRRSEKSLHVMQALMKNAGTEVFQDPCLFPESFGQKSGQNFGFRDPILGQNPDKMTPPRCKLESEIRTTMRQYLEVTSKSGQVAAIEARMTEQRLGLLLSLACTLSDI
ncbi:interferon-inducible GTPase-domain-containing protein [Desarmillaria tabescens]|uniref:Interferon-inducible GTPase-domain-containing protein n=1 Tax=Armillaria tabescens TaxID=1929756 RepID=A0AA39TQ04_ARMTA|nr:interferon-inducible GTPase-domain-containing protein [Desarmillaria tabescens]KAK0462448.1 interferon-inducible GTPase-domain-containing protein [Desarmillaria tabescens]